MIDLDELERKAKKALQAGDAWKLHHEPRPHPSVPDRTWLESNGDGNITFDPGMKYMADYVAMLHPAEILRLVWHLREIDRVAAVLRQADHIERERRLLMASKTNPLLQDLPMAEAAGPQHFKTSSSLPGVERKLFGEPVRYDASPPKIYLSKRQIEMALAQGFAERRADGALVTTLPPGVSALDMAPFRPGLEIVETKPIPEPS